MGGNVNLLALSPSSFLIVPEDVKELKLLSEECRDVQPWLIINNFNNNFNNNENELSNITVSFLNYSWFRF